MFVFEYIVIQIKGQGYRSINGVVTWLLNGYNNLDTTDTLALVCLPGAGPAVPAVRTIPEVHPLRHTIP